RPRPESTLFPYTTLFRSGAASSRSVVGRNLGAISARYSTEYGAKRRPAKAPSAKTTVWAASSGHHSVNSTIARTTVVTTAANRGPRGSTDAGADISPPRGRTPTP